LQKLLLEKEKERKRDEEMKKLCDKMFTGSFCKILNLLNLKFIINLINLN